MEFRHVDDAGGDVYEVQQVYRRGELVIYLDAGGRIEWVDCMGVG